MDLKIEVWNVFQTSVLYYLLSCNLDSFVSNNYYIFAVGRLIPLYLTLLSVTSYLLTHITGIVAYAKLEKTLILRACVVTILHNSNNSRPFSYERNLKITFHKK